MFERLGIGARLFIAFLAITALSLTPGLAGWLILRQISQSQTRMIAAALPAVAAAQRTADASARLVAAAPALTAVADEPSRARQEQQLMVFADEIRASAADAALSAVGGDKVRQLSQTVDAMTANLVAQNRLVSERIALEAHFHSHTEAAVKAAAAIVDLSETLVSNASTEASAVVSNLYGLIENPALRPQAYDALDRLIEQDIYMLDRMWELRLRSSQIGLMVSQLSRAVDDKDVSGIAASYEEQLRIIRRRVASIDDPVRRQQAQNELSTLNAASGASPWQAGLFGERARLIAIGKELDDVAAKNRTLSAQVGAFAESMLKSSEDNAQETAARAAQAVQTGFYLLVLTSAIAVIVASLVVWFYVEGNIVRRLAALAAAMRRLTAGDLAVEVQNEGAPELRALSAAVVAFRDESQKRRALEIERERTNEELRRHREELRELVDERTLQLRDANTLLQQEVASHAEARARAEMASQAKSSFLAAMSHEIRTPMGGMLGMLRVLGDTKLTAAQHRQLAIAAQSGEALLGILNSILDYSKIEAGKITCDPVDFDLHRLISGIVKLMRASAAEKGLSLRLSSDPQLWPRHIGDAGMIRQIVFNLIGNAIKFTAQGRITVTAAAKQASDTDQQVEISVRDTGIGIPADQHAAIFEAFTQKDASITRRYGGTGLGLAISRGLAAAMGGSLTLESEPAAGSTFTLTLTLRRSAASDDLRVSKPKAQCGRSLAIMVVEDDDATREIASVFLTRLGHKVAAMARAEQAVAQFAAVEPDLVFMDISLPDVDGVAAARQLWQLAGARPLPIVAMSAHVFKEDINRYLGAGMADFVAKPLTPEALAGAIALATGRPEAAADIDAAALNADISRLGADTVARILRLADETIARHLDGLKAAAAAGASVEIVRLAHALRSAAAAAGFSALVSTAEACETAAQSGDDALCRELIARCGTDYRAASIEARRLVSGLAG